MHQSLPTPRPEESNAFPAAKSRQTQEQRRASDPARSVWVSANAGTGKTKVLTDRVLRLLLSGTPIERILCITYTRAAAAEMGERIHRELSRWSMADAGALAATLETLTGAPPGEGEIHRARALFVRVADAPEGLRILTIHGFCQSLLRRFPLEAGTAPHFSVIDERTADELLREARLRLFGGNHSGEAPRLADALHALAGRVNEQGFTELLESIVRERRRFGALFAQADGAALGARIFRYLDLAEDTDEAALIALHCTHSAEEAATLRAVCAQQQQGTQAEQQSAAVLARWLAATPEEKPALAKEYLALFLTAEGDLRKKLLNKSTANALPGAEAAMAREQQRVMRWSEARNALATARISTHMLTVAEALLALYQHLKTAHAFMDYDDLILSAQRLLNTPGISPWVLYKLDGGLDHLLIDEAQDTSPEQWELTQALVAEFYHGASRRENAKRTLFVVGDEKQSIYSFQGAQPRAFGQMHSRFEQLAALSGEAFETVRLALSFRSTVPVLQAVDAVFRSAGARAGLSFSGESVLHEACRDGEGGLVELWPLLVQDQAAQEASLPPPWHTPRTMSARPTAQQQLAARIGDTIRNWLDTGEMLASQGRAITPGDVMILVRSRGRRAGGMVETLMRALKRRNIPVSGLDRMVLSETLAVMDLMALGQFVLLPQDDLTLASVLKSPLVGVSEEELFTLAHGRGAASLWERLGAQQHASTALRRAYDYLHGLLAKVDYLPPYEFFAHVLETLGGRQALAARLGAECHDPIDEFLGQCLHYEQVHPPSLQGFLHWMAASSTEIKRDMEHGGGEVRILTVHGAKGLQAPIVFLPDTTRLPSIQKERLLWHEAEDPAERLVLLRPAQKKECAATRELREMREAELMEEYRRLLYVAMTRAEDRLYICGAATQRDVDAASWYGLVHAALAPEAAPVTLRFADDEQAQGWRIESPQTRPVTPRATIASAAPVAPPPAMLTALLTPPAQEPVPPRPLSPSRLTEEHAPPASPLGADATAAQRGMHVHRLLQTLPALPEDNAIRRTAAQRYLSRFAADMEPAAQEALADELLHLLHHPDFAPIFGPGSMAEVPVSGVITGRSGAPIPISGQIDRLRVNPQHVWVVDYKSGRQPPGNIDEIPIAYARQMAAYSHLLRQIYPERAIHAALLFTATPLLLPLPEEVLNRIDLP